MLAASARPWRAEAAQCRPWLAEGAGQTSKLQIKSNFQNKLKVGQDSNRCTDEGVFLQHAVRCDEQCVFSSNFAVC
jgi:hypothetical protein